jgi:hypothetical protein
MIWDRLSGRIGSALRRAICGARNRLRRLTVRRPLRRGKLARIGRTGLRIKLVGNAARRVIEAVSQGENRENEKSADLNNVDRDVYNRRSLYARYAT